MTVKNTTKCKCTGREKKGIYLFLKKQFKCLKCFITLTLSEMQLELGQIQYRYQY